MDASERAEAHRGSYLTDPAPLWCSCFCWLWKPQDTPTTAFKTLTSDKPAAACYSARVGIAYEEKGKPCCQSTLCLTHRETIPPLWFSNSDFSVFLAAVICSFIYSLPSRDLGFLFIYSFILQTCPALLAFVLSVEEKYQLGNNTEVCEERTALASIHARSTPGYLLWNCDPTCFPHLYFLQVFTCQDWAFLSISLVKWSKCRGVLPAVSDATSHTGCMRNTCVEGRELADTNLLAIKKASAYLHSQFHPLAAPYPSFI